MVLKHLVYLTMMLRHLVHLTRVTGGGGGGGYSDKLHVSAFPD